MAPVDLEVNECEVALRLTDVTNSRVDVIGWPRLQQLSRPALRFAFVGVNCRCQFSKSAYQTLSSPCTMAILSSGVTIIGRWNGSMDGSRGGEAPDIRKCLILVE